MEDITRTLLEMRGESSEPLIASLVAGLDEMHELGRDALRVQIPSSLLKSGISLLVDMKSKVVVRLYYERNEIGGYLAPSRQVGLESLGWTLTGDLYQVRFALLSRAVEFVNNKKLAEDIAQALEIMGTPQRKNWGLDFMR